MKLDTQGKIAQLACDWCGARFKRYISQLRTQYHFCSRMCTNHGRKTLVHPLTQQTTQERHGVKCPFEQEHVRQANRDWMSTDEFRQKSKLTCQERYGVDYPQQSPTIRLKTVQSYVEHYGVDHNMRSPEVIAKFDFKRGAQKAHETMKRNGTYGRSAPEDQCYELLTKRFGQENVERQARINGWHVDFYVKLIDTYVQFDGVYWHGLDRPIEVIAECRTKRDVQIHKKWLTDREQERWFAKNQIRLVRVTKPELLLKELEP